MLTQEHVALGKIRFCSRARLSRLRALFRVGARCSDRGARIPVFQHSCLEFQFRVGVWTLALHVLSRVVMSSLGRALVRPRVFCVVARSSYFYRLRAFMLCIELCGTHLVFFSSLAHTHANVPTLHINLLPLTLAVKCTTVLSYSKLTSTCSPHGIYIKVGPKIDTFPLPQTWYRIKSFQHRVKTKGSRPPNKTCGCKPTDWGSSTPVPCSRLPILI